MAQRQGLRVGWVVPVVIGLVAGCSSGDDDGSPPPPTETEAEAEAPTGAGGGPCAGWATAEVATGLGAVENLLVEDDGSVLLSVADAGAVRRLRPDGEVEPLVDGLRSPGGLARGEDGVYVTTGLSIDSAAQGVADGGIVRFDPVTGDHEDWAAGLVAPNGLAVLPDGSAVVTRTLSGAGQAAEVTRIPADDPAHPAPLWSDLTGTNGAALDPAGEWLWVSRVAERAEVWRLRVDDPAVRERVADLGGGVDEILDDLAFGPDGAVYVAAFAAGRVHRVDPGSGSACVVADGLAQPSAVELGADGESLLVSSHAGTVHRLAPPG